LVFLEKIPLNESTPSNDTLDINTISANPGTSFSVINAAISNPKHIIVPNIPITLLLEIPPLCARKIVFQSNLGSF
jgi:hypothetical protein